MNEFLSKAHALKSERANKRFQPTASLAALASRRLKRVPLGSQFFA